MMNAKRYSIMRNKSAALELLFFENIWNISKMDQILQFTFFTIILIFTVHRFIPIIYLLVGFIMKADFCCFLYYIFLLFSSICLLSIFLDIFKTI